MPRRARPATAWGRWVSWRPATSGSRGSETGWTTALSRWRNRALRWHAARIPRRRRPVADQLSPTGQPIGGDTATAVGSRRWIGLAVISMAQLMVALDAAIMNIALPSAQRGLHF